MKGKIIVPLLLASVSAGVVYSTNIQQNVSVFADTVEVTNVVGNTVQITNFTSTGTIGNPVTLPTVTVIGTADILTPTVTDPTGRVLVNASEILGNAFTPQLKGYYTVVYSTIEDGRVVTKTDPLRIYISGEDYSLTLKSNSKYVIPATIPTSTTNALKIPAPYIYNGDELVDVATAISAGELEVSILSRDGNNSSQVLTASTPDSDGEYFYEWMPTSAGIYEVVYKYIKGTVQDYITQRFVVKADYDTSDIVLNFSYASSRLDTLTLGVEATFPKINITDKTTGDSIEGYTKITVEHVGTGTTYVLGDDYTFTPTLAGDYKVTYQARLDYFGLASVSNTWSIIRDVADTVAPTIITTNSYTFDQETGEILTVINPNDANNPFYDVEDLSPTITEDEKQELLTKALGNLSYDVPSVAYLAPTGVGSEVKATITLPAAYGSDNVTKANGFTITRSIRKNINNNISVVDTGSANQTATYDFTEAGNYTIRYSIKDEAGNEKLISFDMKVVSSEDVLKDSGGVDFVVPVITMNALPAYIKANATLTFNAPTATDTHDTRVEVKVFYSFDNDATLHQITTKNDSGQYVLDLNGLVPVNAEELYVTAVAYNDYGQTATRLNTINLIATNDTVAPEFETTSIDNYLTNLATVNGITGTIQTDGDLYQMVELVETNVGEPFEQKDTVILPTVTVTDVTDPNVELSVKVTDPYGKTVTVSNSVFTSLIGTAYNTFTIGEGTFVANYSGLYKITYSAKDAGGNLIVRSYGVRVKDTEKPTILLSSFDPFTSSVEVGKFIEMPRATLKDNGVVLENVPFGRYEDTYFAEDTAGISWKLVSGPVTNTAGMYGFTPTVAGEYVVVYEGWDENGNTTETKSYTIVASDSLKPTIELEKDFSWFPVDYVSTTPVQLPAVINLYDGALPDSDSGEIIQTPSEDLEVAVTVTNANGEEMEVTTAEETVNSTTLTRYYFQPTANGVYTVIYSTVDLAGNTYEITNTIEVGDVNAPELDWADGYELKTEVTIGDTFALDTSKMVITDNDDEVSEITKQIYMYQPDNTIAASEISGGYSWTLDQVGTWQLKVTLTDTAGNKETYTYSIVVSEETVEEQVIEPWLGTTLIVVTAVILAGVVVYFIVTSKGVNGKSTSRRRKTTKK